MANRNLKAKRLKLQRHIRALPRQVGQNDIPGHFVNWEGTKFPDRLKAERVKAPGGMNKFVVEEYKNRTRSLGVSMGEINELVLKLYGRLFIGTPAGRKEVLDTIKQLRKQKVENQFFQMRDNAYERTRMYYRSDRSMFIIVRDDKRRLVTQISLPYSDKSTALRAWTLDRVHWEKKLNTQVAPP